MAALKDLYESDRQVFEQKDALYQENLPENNKGSTSCGLLWNQSEKRSLDVGQAQRETTAVVDPPADSSLDVAQMVVISIRTTGRSSFCLMAPPMLENLVLSDRC